MLSEIKSWPDLAWRFSTPSGWISRASTENYMELLLALFSSLCERNKLTPAACRPDLITSLLLGIKYKTESNLDCSSTTLFKVMLHRCLFTYLKSKYWTGAATLPLLLPQSLPWIQLQPCHHVIFVLGKSVINRTGFLIYATRQLRDIVRWTVYLATAWYCFFPWFPTCCWTSSPLFVNQWHSGLPY
jgi:hypothetical protein